MLFLISPNSASVMLLDLSAIPVGLCAMIILFQMECTPPLASLNSAAWYGLFELPRTTLL